MRKLSIFLLTVSMVLFTFNCDEMVDPEEGPASTDTAKKVLADVMYNAMNSEGMRPSDLDVSTAHSIFNNAYQANPDDPDANFGLALTNLMMITQSSEIQNMTEEWIQILGPESGDALGKETAKNFQPVFPSSSPQSFMLNEDIIAKGYLNLPQSALQDPPKFSEVQDLLENEVLSRVNTSIEHLENVENDTSYTFKITPRMQGDMNRDTLEVDLTEVYALDASLRMLKAAGNLTIAYNVDTWGLDSSEAFNAYSQEGQFLSLRENGAESMNTVKTSINTAADKVESALDFLENETDDQSNDAISQNEFDKGEKTKIRNGIDSVRTYLSGQQTIKLGQDLDNDGQNESITVNLSQLFENPIENMTEKLPEYNLTGISSEGATTWKEDTLTLKDSVTVAESGKYYIDISSDDDSEYYYSSDFDTTEIPNIWNTFDSLNTVFANNYDGYYFEIDESYNLEAGKNEIEVSLRAYYSVQAFTVWVPSSAEWEADSYGNWSFPDPTLNGILPNMTDQKLKMMLGITESSWQKQIPIPNGSDQ